MLLLLFGKYLGFAADTISFTLYIDQARAVTSYVDQAWSVEMEL